jgi:hypothetical protein
MGPHLAEVIAMLSGMSQGPDTFSPSQLYIMKAIRKSDVYRASSLPNMGIIINCPKM